MHSNFPIALTEPNPNEPIKQAFFMNGAMIILIMCGKMQGHLIQKVE